ncbi:FtsX-like permease family protein [Flammeovirgaceae bacterium SG7u.111]|nr:FtsX-like permease family protein [Flammeovirgaceae bacterium SG7u.132]WPO38033.1 FtsX-like permease family protein [Flammeovirgaceae bacterium SG7u.111]
MLKNYLKIAFRNIYKYKVYSIVNILGLSVGIAFFTLLLLIIRHEISYDVIHSKSSRIFRATKYIEKEGVGERSATLPFPFGTTLAREYPFYVEEVVRVFNFQIPYHSVQHGKKQFNEDKFYFVDESFFDVFDYPLAEGSPDSVLIQPLSVILSDEAAKRYFGEENPVGKRIRYEERIYLTVTGVFAPRDYASHFEFDFISPLSSLSELVDEDIVEDNWNWDPCWTYMVLAEDKSPEDLEYMMNEMVDKFFPPSFKEYVDIYLQPLKEIHLYSDLDNELNVNGDVSYVYIFAIIALLILIIATINFTNLSSAKSALRAREIGIRQAIGATRLEILQQFFVEFLFISIIAVVLAFVIVETSLPQLGRLTGTPLDFTRINKTLMISTVLGSGFIIGALSSLVPAYYLSRYHPAEVLMGSILPGIKSKRFRGILVVIQFVITVFLLVTTLVSFKQFLFLRSASLGFNKENIVILPANNNIKFQYDSLKEMLLESPHIISVTAMEEVLGSGHRTNEYLPEECDCEDDWMFFSSLIVRQDFLETFEIKLLAGRSFSVDTRNDDYYAVIVNRKLVEFMGWESPEDAIGKVLHSRSGNERVIGVVEDFNFESLHNEVAPLVLDLASSKFKIFFTKYIAVKVEESSQKEALAHINYVWRQHLPKRSFEYFFLDNKLGKMYTKELTMGRITAYFAIVAIIIACLGLFGLSSFVVNMRRKEIAIRKAIGTTNWDIIILLSKEFFLLVTLALFISWPISYFVLQSWLESFPFHTSLDFEVYLVTGLIAFLTTATTISFHTIKAARKEPTKALQL